MKKEINSKSKRKWVAGGLAAFASIALLTTGFATWVVGTQQTSADENVTVTVDSAKNAGISFEFKLDTDRTLELKEMNTVGKKPIVNIKDNDGVSDNLTPLQIFATYTIKWGKAYEDEHKSNMFTKIQLSILDATTAGAGYADNTVASDDVKTERSGGPFTYFDLETISIDLSDLISQAKSAAHEGTREIKVDTPTKIQFKWGSLFENDTPATYYNRTYTTPTMEQVTNVYDELTAMYNKYQANNKIKLRAELAQ